MYYLFLSIQGKIGIEEMVVFILINLHNMEIPK